MSGEITKSEQEILLAEAETAAKDYQRIYKEKPEISLKEMVEKMGKRGYIIIDENNQTNFAESEEAKKVLRRDSIRQRGNRTVLPSAGKKRNPADRSDF